ncbi:peptidoglycan bridge formation glycyltransferase FemA/FemB family protein [Candidatus Saccharibacteria bacterium]|nr:peptidoglycan bridge formation glycyltransferase FemA/FemB family protein [Candidatus Saccharibacteria bacterium]
MTYKIETATNQTKWDKFITSHKEANFLQSWDFYKFHESRGNEVVRRIILDDKDKIIGAYAGVIEHAKRGKHLAIAGGPIIEWANKKLVKAVFDDIKEQGQKYDCVFVRVRPQLKLSEKSLKLFKNLGLKKAPMYLSVEYAGILDLNLSEEEILKNASQGFRRKLRKAAKAEIVIEKSTDPKDIKKFYQIQLETAKRHDFFAFSEDFLTKQFAAFAENNEVTLYIAKQGKEILAENFIIFYGNEASYHYGVSSELGTRLSSAPLLHIAAMKDARERGIKRYNLWGIVGLDEKKHRFYGVSEFKRSFGCTELKYTPAHDLILNKPKYLVTKAIESARKRARHV